MDDIDNFLAMDLPSFGGDFVLRKIAPGDFIFLEGQPGNAAYVIMRGEVQVTTEKANGELVIISRMKAGEMFGEIALLTPECVRTATTISEKGCELLVIEPAAFEAHMLKVDLMTQYIMSQFCKRIIALTDRLRDE